MERSNILGEALGGSGDGHVRMSESNHFPMKKASRPVGKEACLVLATDQVRYWIRKSEMPGKNSSSRVRTVSLIRKGKMPL